MRNPEDAVFEVNSFEKEGTHRYYLILGRILSKSAMISEDDAGDERACGIHFGEDICFPNGFKHFGLE